MRVIIIVLVVLPLVFADKYNEVYYSSPLGRQFARGSNDSGDDLTGLTQADMSCGQHQSRRSYPDKACGSKKVEKSDCSEYDEKGCILYSATARKAYLHCCPEMECSFLTVPCPRKDWNKEVISDFLVSCVTPNVAYLWHYEKKSLNVDTLYDMQTNHMVDVTNRDSKEYMGTKIRFHTCIQAAPVDDPLVAAYGIGWIYLKWRRPLENCYTELMYKESYTVNKTEFNQSDISDFVDRDSSLYFFRKFHPCPEYPAWFCFIISENVPPFTEFEFQVAYERFKGESSVDSAKFTKINVSTNAQQILVPFCPPVNFFLTFFFFILLVVVFVVLLIVAAVLLGLLLSRKKNEERRKDMEELGVEEEQIPPTTTTEKLWERLKNFLDTLCPRPKVPPPPPPPPPEPPPKPKSTMKRPKTKLTLKAKPKPPPPPPKPPTPTPTPSPRLSPVSPPSPLSPPPPPPPPPPPKHKKRKTSELKPPPAAPPPPRKKTPREARSLKRKGREAAAIDTKRAVSAVGGGGGKRHRRPH